MFQALFEGEMKKGENGIDYKSILLNFGYIPHVNIANKNDNSINSVNDQIDVLNKNLQQLINKEL